MESPPQQSRVVETGSSLSETWPDFSRSAALIGRGLRLTDLGSDRLINGFRRLRRLRKQHIDLGDLFFGEIAALDRFGVDEHI